MAIELERQHIGNPKKEVRIGSEHLREIIDEKEKKIKSAENEWDIGTYQKESDPLYEDYNDFRDAKETQNARHKEMKAEFDKVDSSSKKRSGILSFNDYNNKIPDSEKGGSQLFDRGLIIGSVQKKYNTAWMESWELDAVIKAFEKIKKTTLSEDEAIRFSYELRKSANIDVEYDSVERLTGKDAVAEIEKVAIVMRDILTPKLKKAKRLSDSDQIQKYEDEIYELQKEVLGKIGIRYTFNESRLTHLEYAELFKELENYGLRQTHLKHFIPKFFYSLKSHVARNMPESKLSDIIAPAPAGTSLF